MGARNCWVMVAILGFWFQAQFLNSQNLTCNPKDWTALQEFMGNLTTKLQGWTTNSPADCCEWEGITCDIPSSSGRVIKLELSRKRLLSGQLSDSLAGLDQLKTLNLSNNFLKGSLPMSLFHMPKLELLDLSNNDLDGTIPESIDLPSIQTLDISSNSFNGSLPSHICVNSTRIRNLNLAVNYFSGNILPGFGNCSSLEQLFLGMNDLTGGITEDIFHLQILTILGLQNNNFHGKLNPAMVSLNSLNLGTNKFNGPLPDNLPLCRQLKNINLARNNFSDQIPESFREFQSLSFLSLSNSSLHNISSALQILQHCRNLTTLVLTLNFRNETLPDDPNLHFEKLKVLVIVDCGLNGSIPQWLRNISSLQLLDVSWNHLTGTIPPWFGTYRDLFYLDLSNNFFTGEISKSLTELPSLIYRNVTLEKSSPDFPFFLRIIGRARGLQYNQVWSFPPTLDLSHNLLSGPIWSEFGNLRKLHVLNLKFNRLSGPIPGSLSGMISLEKLDLSHNHLSGTIPSSLKSLTFLSSFSVAYNQLHGKIPSGGQFETFPSSSFEGNNLCGDLHWVRCQGGITDEDDQKDSPKSSGMNKYFVQGMVPGILFGTVSSVLCINLYFKDLIPKFLSKWHKNRMHVPPMKMVMKNPKKDQD
ncbi:hypothetical protein COLO4_27654 [Corchorus olitorius]|uniref:Leucine-rich repeat-containing N-terminal plant-type domain-containing protein n=1 Tax=Corchorus olitorius TaxID=93759 RepID=A0A1R3HQ68_9ROSI|nr:hypothetical protein COLO4_27654 [Corchorus olitorius]